MAWSDDTARVLSACMDKFGVPTSYTPKGGVAGNVVGIFYASYVPLGLVGGISVSSVQPALGVKLSSMAAPPRRGDRFVVGATTYEVRDVEEDGGGGAKLLAHKV